ncbi:MAG: hypothetical protein K1X36_10630 [Pyrinomonadaceae bacterium]|nr:hypothetical protein [Pyrinomonadaceae bacterium]
MVNRDEVRAANRSKSKNDIERPSRRRALPSNYSILSQVSSDDVILSLIDAHENVRARQVSEWEMLRRQTVRRAA